MHGEGESQKFQPKIAPLLSLTEEYPVTIDAKNRQELLENPQRNLEEEKRNVYLFHLKTFPWEELLAILLFVIIVMIIKFKPKNQGLLAQKTKEDQIFNARKKGLDSLEALRKNDLLKNQKFEEFYLQITDTVRHFVEEKFQIKTSIKTTQEFLQEMTQYPKLDKKTQTLLSDFLLRADHVKFAVHLPTPKECEEAYKAAETLIKPLA